MELACSKCGSNKIHSNVPVVSNIASLGLMPVAAVAYNRPDAWVFKNPVIHPFVANVCSACGFSEFYIENPQVFGASIPGNLVGDQ